VLAGLGDSPSILALLLLYAVRKNALKRGLQVTRGQRPLFTLPVAAIERRIRRLRGHKRTLGTPYRFCK
jgi:hypothetical protein